MITTLQIYVCLKCGFARLPGVWPCPSCGAAEHTGTVLIIETDPKKPSVKVTNFGNGE